MTELPSGWTESTLGALAETVRGLTYKKAQASGKAADGLIPLLRATNVQDGRLLLDSELLFLPESLVRKEQWLRLGDIVIASSSGSSSVVGKSAPVREEWRGTFGAFCTVLRPTEQVEPRFLAHLVGSPAVRRRWSELASGTNINNLKSAHLTETRVALPPLREQQRIVDAIEELLTRLDAADASLADADRRSEAMRQGVLSTAFGPITATRPLGDVAQTQLGKMLSAKSRTGVGSRPYLRNKNVQWGRIYLDDLLLMDFSMRDSAKFSLRTGDVLVCEGGEVGRAAVWRGELDGCCYQKALHRVRVGDHLVPEFLVHVFRWMADRNAFDAFVTGSTIKHLPQEDLRMLPIPCPPVDEQQRIVVKVEAQLSAIDVLRSAIAQAQRRSASLRRGVLGLAFRGELVAQDSSDEPASMLLERIRTERAAAPAQPRRRRVNA